MSPRVPSAHKEQRRQTILKAAVGAFIGRGYQLTTIDDIATRAGLSVGAIYRYFPSKSAIMLALMEERLGRAPELLQRLTAGSGDPWEQLTRAVDVFVRAVRIRHPESTRLLLVAFAEALQDREVQQGLRARFAGLQEFLAEVIRRGVDSGRFRPGVDPAGVAALLLCAADGATIYASIDTPNAGVRDLRALTLSMLRRYLFRGEEDGGPAGRDAAGTRR